MEITIRRADGTSCVMTPDIKKLIVVGFSGCDKEKTMEHIHELEKAGVKCPEDVPVVYECDPQIITQKQEISVVGDKTSGEAEYLVLIQDGKTYIGIGSDHTDRDLEAVSIHKSKQLCLKPCSKEFWPYEDVKDHFESLRIQSRQIVKGTDEEYQDGHVSDMLPLEDILNKVAEETVPEQCLIYTGTVPLKNGFRFGEEFSCSLKDEKLGRSISLSYKIRAIREH
mgnify:FL=1